MECSKIKKGRTALCNFDIRDLQNWRKTIENYFVDDEECDEYYYKSIGYHPQPRKIIPYTHSWYARSHQEYQGDVYQGTFDIRFDGIHAKQIIQRHHVRELCHR